MTLISWAATTAKTQPDRTAPCEKHGEFQSKNLIGQIWSKCPACNAEETLAAKAKEDAEFRNAKLLVWQQKVGNAGIPERFHNRSLQSFVATTDEQRYALDFATRYADDFDSVLRVGRNAIFVGKPGTGKTHLAVGIGLRIMRRDKRTVLFTTVMRAIRRVKDTWAKNSTETESQAVAALVFPDLLILDEVGVQFGSDTEKLILFDVLNERYEKRKPTILLSNLTVQEVQTFIGERIADRFREDGGESVPFDWGSHRGAA